MNKIYYNLPDFYLGINFYFNLLQIKKEYPELFYDNVEIKSIFGNFPNVIWNGGSYFFGKTHSVQDIQEIFFKYKLLDIPLKLTMTNPLLTKEDCFDRYCNMILTVAQDFDNIELLISSPILEDYIKNKYPNFKLNKSIIASETDYDFEEALLTYNNIVLPRKLSKNFNFLQSIKIENRSKMELLCNDPCPIECPNLYSHYKEYAKISLYEKPSINEDSKCIIFNNNNSPIKKFKFIDQQITYNDIVESYLPNNFNNFKISGRGNIFTIAENTIKYMIKPEYQIRVFSYLLDNLF